MTLTFEIWSKTTTELNPTGPIYALLRKLDTEENGKARWLNATTQQQAIQEVHNYLQQGNWTTPPTIELFTPYTVHQKD